MTYDIIIIGGGISGLATGALLARNKYKVCVFEASRTIGGRAQVHKRDGYVVDYGIHANRFASDGDAAKVFRKLGYELEFVLPGTPMVYQKNKDMFYPLPKGVSGILRTKLLRIRSRFKLLKLLRKVLQSQPSDYWNISIANWLELEGVKAQDLWELITIYSIAGLVCADIHKASAGELFAFIQQALRVKHTMGYPKLGWDGLFNILRSVLTGSGGKLRTGTKITRIVIETTKARTLSAIGVELPGEELIQARAIVCAFPLQNLFSLISKKYFTPSFCKRLATLEPTCGVTMDFGLNKRISDIDGLILTNNPPTMGYFTSNFASYTAETGKQLGTWYYILDAKTIADKQKAQNALSELRELIARMFPGIWNHEAWHRTMTLHIVDGAAPIVGQTHQDRPGFIAPNIKNLFFAGDTTKADGWGGDVAWNSAIQCANHVDKYLKKCLA